MKKKSGRFGYESRAIAVIDTWNEGEKSNFEQVITHKLSYKFMMKAYSRLI